MTKIDKLYTKIVRNPKDVSFAEIDKILKQYGFSCRQPGSGSSHYHYYHPNLVEIVTIPYARPIKAVYIKEAIKALKKLQEGSESE